MISAPGLTTVHGSVRAVDDPSFDVTPGSRPAPADPRRSTHVPGGTVSTPRSRYLLALGVCVGTVLFLLLGIGALGIVGDGDRDWVYLASPVVLLLVAVATRFRPGGMVIALGAAALTTLVAGAVAIAMVATDRATASVADVVGLTVMYAVLFAAGAWLFSRVRVSDA